MPPDELAEARREMVDRQLRARDIVDEDVLRAMERVPRELFVPERERRRAYDDAALPIGHGQTISQPYMVARICEATAVRPGQRVLDVGTGSGYQAAVLAELGAEVVTIERIPELAEQARDNLVRAGYENVQVVVGDGTLGVPERAPFDAIGVDAVFEGDEERVQSMVEWCRRGPRGAQVDDVETTEEAPVGETGFEVR